MNEEIIEVILKYWDKEKKDWDFWTTRVHFSQIPNKYDTVAMMDGGRSIKGYIDYVERFYTNGKLIKVILGLGWVEILEKE